MRVSGTTVQKFLLGMALLSALAWNLVRAGEIKDLSIKSGATGTRAEIALDQAVEFKLIRLTGPDRLVVDLSATRLPHGVALPSGVGVVKAVRGGHPSPEVTRVVFDLAQPVTVLEPRMEHGAGAVRLVLEWPGDGEEIAASQPAVAASAAATPLSGAAQTPPASAAGGVDTFAASNAATTRLITELAARAEVKSASVSQTGASAGASATALPPPQGAASKPAAVAPQSSTTAIAAAGAATPAQSAPASDSPTNAVKTAKDVMLGNGMRGMRPLVIAIDAGHGGQDPGAIGPSGKREKDVVLAIARELARQVNATPGMRAYLVRDTDVYVERPHRARRARTARADMFVSIHADAATNRKASGSSVFTLSTRGASSQYARWAADRENASDLVGGVRLEQGTLSSVLLDLAQTGHMKASQDAAKLVLNGLQQVGRNHKQHVEYANFEVLRNADMPAMLVETGFISNPQEERHLADPAYQRRLARAVLEGVNTYFERQPPPGTLYAARAADLLASGTGGSR